MPSQLLVVTAIAVLQWLCVSISLYLLSEFDFTITNAFFAGNIQTIILLLVYQTIIKYVKF